MTPDPAPDETEHTVRPRCANEHPHTPEHTCFLLPGHKGRHQSSYPNEGPECWTDVEWREAVAALRPELRYPGVPLGERSVLQHQNETLRAELAETRKAVDAFHRSAAAMAVELVGLRAEVTRKDHGWKLALDELEKSDEELDALKAGRAAAEWQLQEALETIGALPLMPDEAPADLGPLTPHPPPYPVRWTHPPDEECIHCATPDRLASADPVIDCPREECPFDRATRARRPARRIRSVSDKISANLPGIQKSTMSVPGVWSGPKEGDRITVDLGNGKMIDHIATGVTRDGYGGFSVASRPATPEDGPRTREQRKMVRAMRWSRCRWKMRAWVDRVFRLEARPA